MDVDPVTYPGVIRIYSLGEVAPFAFSANVSWGPGDAGLFAPVWVCLCGGFLDPVCRTTTGLGGALGAVNGPLHSPWGVALAPANFGPMSNAILISNNTPKGQINAFNPKTGEYLGALRDLKGKEIEIDNVWAIQFGQGAAANGSTNQLFFTAGPNAYANGLFGTITVGN
jgi:hypothetical protein